MAHVLLVLVLVLTCTPSGTANDAAILCVRGSTVIVLGAKGEVKSFERLPVKPFSVSGAPDGSVLYTVRACTLRDQPAYGWLRHPRGGTTALPQPAQALEDASEGVHEPALSPDGRTVAAVVARCPRVGDAADISGPVIAMPVARRGGVTIVRGSEEEFDGVSTQPTWSADGRLVLVGHEAGFRVYQMPDVVTAFDTVRHTEFNDGSATSLGWLTNNCVVFKRADKSGSIATQPPLVINMRTGKVAKLQDVLGTNEDFASLWGVNYSLILLKSGNAWQVKSLVSGRVIADWRSTRASFGAFVPSPSVVVGFSPPFCAER